MTKYIFVAGGVISGVGKGVTTASIAKLLQACGFKVTAIKIDPYLNYDAGTLRPTEHGEVWVTDDGGEIDQDLGNYERFLGIDLPKKNCLTSGQIYKTVIDRERKGEYLGETVQFIPHIPEEIKKRIIEASKGYEIAIIEIGGTIGDFENIPFLFAAKRLERDLGKENIIYVLVTYLPIPSHMGEMKTKPTQQAIRMLSESGIFPDFIVCRSKMHVDAVRKKKIETYANIKSEHVISEPDIDTIYRIPLDLAAEKLPEKILAELELEPKKSPDLSQWAELVDRVANSKKAVRVAMVGKYVATGDFSLSDSYISVNESLKHAGAALNCKVQIDWIDAKKLEDKANVAKMLKDFEGIIVPGGFGASGVEGKINAIQYAREHKVPYLGLCYGMQLAVIEFARNICGLAGANTTENEKDTPHPVIDMLESQREILKQSDFGGTMRLGAYVAALRKGTLIADLYKDRMKEDAPKIAALEKDPAQKFRIGKTPTDFAVIERHRHRYEVNPQYIEQIEAKGMLFSGHHVKLDGTKLMEFMELPGHPYFTGTQAHPEFKSGLGRPAPLFYGFVKACCESK